MKKKLLRLAPWLAAVGLLGGMVLGGSASAMGNFNNNSNRFEGNQTFNNRFDNDNGNVHFSSFNNKNNFNRNNRDDFDRDDFNGRGNFENHNFNRFNQPVMLTIRICIDNSNNRWMVWSGRDNDNINNCRTVRITLNDFTNNFRTGNWWNWMNTNQGSWWDSDD